MEVWRRAKAAAKSCDATAAMTKVDDLMEFSVASGISFDAGRLQRVLKRLSQPACRKDAKEI